MMESFLILSRETLEASLVVGIVLAYLSRTNNNEYKKSVYYGLGFGVVSSILFAILFTVLAGGFEGRAEQLFEGFTMIIGAFLLTTMILWMMRQKHIAEEIHYKVDYHLKNAKPLFSHYGIFMLIVVAILREGVETVIFLNALNYASGVNLIGGVVGIAVAIFVGYLFFVGSTKISLKKLFSYSSVLLIFFAAGLVAHGVHEFEEAGVLNPIVYPVWDLNPAENVDGSFPALHEKGVVGSFAKGLFGYNGNPSLLELIAYVSYFGLIWFFWRRIETSKVNQNLQ